MSLGETNTPAVSDASMATWMNYLFGQDAQLINTPPTNITGVPVVLNVIDPNGNWYEIGNVTTNAQGHYSFDWTPTISGLYTITAAFTGSGAYYRSSSQTALSVADPAPTATPTASPLQSFSRHVFCSRNRRLIRLGHRSSHRTGSIDGKKTSIKKPNKNNLSPFLVFKNIYER